MNIHSLMRQFSIRTRMLGAIAAVMLLLSMVGGAGLLGMFRIEAINQTFANSTVAEGSKLGDLRHAISMIRRHEKDMLLSYEKPEKVEAARVLWAGSLAETRQHVEAMLAGEEDSNNPILRKVVPLLDEYEKRIEPVLRQLAANGYDTASVADRMMGPAKAAIDRTDGLMDELKGALQAESEASQAHTASTVTWTITLFFGAVVLAVLVVVPMTLLNMVSICRPLSQAQTLAQAIAKGDLTKTIRVEGRDETAALQNALADMQASLSTMVSNVRLATDSIGTASSEIATGNADLSSRTEQTASNLQQTASSMEQLTGTVKQTADSARTANQLASSAQASAAKGGSVVSQVVSTMEDIHASSRKIADIIGVIDGIAFQTNILALNAAVEAARAGEQGRGFAVVAGEVRNLAQRSAQAAKEIKSLIGASVDKVESGTKLVADAGQTMEEIVGSVQRVSDIIGEITAAAAEQSDGIGQVNTAVTQLDQMTQQNAALVEESAAAADSLRQQAEGLKSSMATFKID